MWVMDEEVVMVVGLFVIILLVVVVVVMVVLVVEARGTIEEDGRGFGEVSGTLVLVCMCCVCLSKGDDAVEKDKEEEEEEVEEVKGTDVEIIVGMVVFGKWTWESDERFGDKFEQKS